MSFERLRRVNYAPPTAATNCLSGQAVEADFQQYHLPAARAHNLALHGVGVAAGLSLSIAGGRVVVSPGAAVDRQGQLIVLAANGRFSSGEAKTLGNGPAGVDLPPAPAAGGTLRFVVSIEHAEDPRADDPASPQCGMVEQVPWVRLRPAGADLGNAVVLGTVNIDQGGNSTFDAKDRVVGGHTVGSVRLRQSAVEGGSLLELQIGAIRASGPGLQFNVNNPDASVTVCSDNGGPFDTFSVVAATAMFSANVTVGGRLNGRDVAADGNALDAHMARADNPHHVTPAQIGSLPVSERVPTGTIMCFGGGSAPVGWALCDGSALSKADPQFAALFAVIGTRFGGDASSFRLPDLRGRVAIGSGQGAGLTDRSLGQAFGSESHKLTVGELAQHSHTGTTGSGNAMFYRVVHRAGENAWNNHVLGWDGGGGYHDKTDASYPASLHTHGFTSNSTGSNQPFQLLQPSLALNFIIKL